MIINHPIKSIWLRICLPLTRMQIFMKTEYPFLLVKDSFALVSMCWSLNATCYCLQEHKSVGRKNPPARPRPFGMIIKVKPQAKKAKLDPGTSEKPSDVVKILGVDPEKSLEPVTTSNSDTNESQDFGIAGLVSYSDESEEDD